MSGGTPTNERPVITLTSDFGLDDWYVAGMKAAIVRVCPGARLIDITHTVPPGDVLCASISLERAIDGFPAGTVHLCVVDPGVGSERRMLIASIRGHWIVCPDNGLITWAWRRHGAGEVYELTWRPAKTSSTFHGRDIMGPAAARLACGAKAQELGRKITDPILLDVAPAAAPLMAGRIIHLDRFGNATTNVPDAILRDVKDSTIRVRGVALPMARTYTDVPPGEALALIGSSGLLEVAVRDGSAKGQLGLRVGDEITFGPPQVPAATAELRRLDKEHVWHPFTHMKLWMEDDPLVIVAAEGMHLIDSDGNRYLDGVSSLWCNVHGHRVREIDDAVRAQLNKVAHSTMLGLANEPAIRLAERLMRVVPRNLSKVFYSDAGATATEIAFKMAVQYWHNLGRGEKCEFVGFGQAYHGDTTGAMSVGRVEAFHRPYFPLLFKVHFAPSPTGDGAKEIAALEQILRQHATRIAAVAIEPLVQGAAGMIVHPQGFLREVRRLTTQYDVLLIADEVATGFGRTGTMFACEQESVEPDLMCVGKGITGGYMPLAATFATQRIFDAFLGGSWEGKTFFHGHTYTGNPLACAAALASLNLFERRNLLQHVQRVSAELSRMLEPARAMPHVGDIRQKGMMVGVELVEDKSANRAYESRLRMGAMICQQIRRHGVILRPLGDVLVLMPPLAMEVGDLRKIVDAVATEIAALH